MNSITRVSAIASQYRTDTQSSWQQRTNDFEALQSALRSGNLWAAQQAFMTLQQNSSQAASTSNAFGQNSQAAIAFQALESALDSGNLSAAQQAFATLQLECSG
jgi:hypothetical protein